MLRSRHGTVSPQPPSKSNQIFTMKCFSSNNTTNKKKYKQDLKKKQQQQINATLLYIKQD